MTTYINSDEYLLLNKYGPSGQGRAMNQRFPLMLTSDMSPTLKVSIFSGLTFKVGHSHPTLQFLYQLLIDHSPQKSCAVYFKQTARDDEFYTIVRLVLWSRNIMFKVSQNITMVGGMYIKSPFLSFLATSGRCRHLSKLLQVETSQHCTNTRTSHQLSLQNVYDFL